MVTSGFGQAATMGAALLVFLYEGFAYNVVYLHRVLPAMDKKDLQVPFLILFNTTWGMAMWSYLRAHTADPGYVPRLWAEFVESVGSALPIAPARPEWQPGKVTWCKKCDIPRPERAHHCVISGTCVLRMDHYCPWINNCVGFKNHKYFLLLGTYACLASYVALITSFADLISCIGLLGHVDTNFSLGEESSLEIADVFAFLIFGFLALFIGLLLTPMLMAHVPLATLNVTTIEDNYRNMPNPYDQGSAHGNLSQVMGAFGIDWFFPIAPWKPLSDGVSFARAGERVGPDGLPERVIGEAEFEVEDVWRLRYHVIPLDFETGREFKEDNSFASLSRLWSCNTRSY
jgi:palmitoyltransferase